MRQAAPLGSAQRELARRDALPDRPRPRVVLPAQSSRCEHLGASRGCAAPPPRRRSTASSRRRRPRGRTAAGSGAAGAVALPVPAAAASSRARSRSTAYAKAADEQRVLGLEVVEDQRRCSRRGRRPRRRPGCAAKPRGRAPRRTVAARISSRRTSTFRAGHAWTLLAAALARRWRSVMSVSPYARCSTHAPFDAGALGPGAAALRRVARCCPAEAYTSTDGARLGAAAPLRRHLDLPRPRRRAVPEQGDAVTQRAVVVGDVPVLLTCEDSGRSAAFANTCRHRGHELLPDGGTSSKRASSARTTRGPTTSTASLHRGAGLPRTSTTFDPDDARAGRAAGRGLARLGVRQRDWRRRAPFAEHVGELDDAGRRRTRPERLVRRRAAHVRGRGELEGHHRELPRVLPLPADPPGAVPGQPADQRATTTTCPAPGSAARWTCATAWRRCRSTGASDGRADPRRRPDAGALPRAVAQPALSAAPRLRDDAPDGCRWRRTGPGSSARGTSCPATTAQVPDPAYAVDFWDLTNRQDWAACESVQRGLASPHFRPGPFAPNEDAVHQFVTMVARGYLGESQR